MNPLHAKSLANVAEQLRDDEIHVWLVNYQREQGRMTLRTVLGAYLDTPAAGIELSIGEHGRPGLAASHDATLGFNWSHSGDHALIAVGRGVTPGVDVERKRPRPRALDIARRFFSADETAALSALPATDIDSAFLQLWTAKEAVLKAVGHGLSFGLDRLSIANVADDLVLRALDGDNVEAWQLQRLTMPDTLIAALAWRGRPRHVRLGMLADDE